MKIVVGMSGGVDSAVAAYLLQKQGYEVIGLFMKNWDSDINHDLEGITDEICPQEQDYIDAKKVCDTLSIALYRVDFIKEYWDNVFTYFLTELEKGRTPNPDIMCNKYIKFDLFKNEAQKLGAQAIATGHYAVIKDGKLYKAKDSSKDQTYFLSQVTKEQFKDVLFPLGDLTKSEVRKVAKNINLSVADKKDSTGICFIGERHYQKFISNYLKPNPGDIVNVETNKVIGKHSGLMNYTIGQRRNIGLSGDDKRHYVCGKDVEQNILYIAFGDDNNYLTSDECIIENFNYISEKRPQNAACKFRYRSEEVEIQIEYLENNELKIKYKSAKAVTPGQACVIYLKDEVIGGGIIKKVRKNNKSLWYLMDDPYINIKIEPYDKSSPADLSKGNLILVNKKYYLEKEYRPHDIEMIDEKYSAGSQFLKKDVINKLKNLIDDAKKENLNIIVSSAFRGYSRQKAMYINIEDKSIAARPGHSEHQTGLCVDITAPGENITREPILETKEIGWIEKNAHKYGFIVRFPKGKENITGFKYEPWHLRYVGEEAALKIKELSITFDEYYEKYIKN